MNRRTLTTVAAGLIAITLCVLGITLPVPMVALGPGPTYNTLGEVDGTEVVKVDGLAVYPTAGNLNMTTVSVTDRLTLFNVIGYWAASDRRVVPRDTVFPVSLSDQQVQDRNHEQFATSEVNAESAALTELGMPGNVTVVGLVADAPAAATLKLGDELITVAGRPVDSVEAVSTALVGSVPGQTVPITYQRGDAKLDGSITLTSTQGKTQGILGIIPAVVARGGGITFGLGGVGGPSAGLMFALSIVDKLTPGELTGGRFIAGTGAIGPTGTVTPIDGVPFKMRAARDAGATVFLVPNENCAEAASTAPDGLQLVRVHTLHEAKAALDGIRDGKTPESCG